MLFFRVNGMLFFRVNGMLLSWCGAELVLLILPQPILGLQRTILNKINDLLYYLL